jgi:hypothetical protein
MMSGIGGSTGMKRPCWPGSDQESGTLQPVKEKAMTVKELIKELQDLIKDDKKIADVQVRLDGDLEYPVKTVEVVWDRNQNDVVHIN